MYGISKEFPLDAFPGAMLEQVCVGSNDLIMRFSGETSIMVTSSIHFQGEDEPEGDFKMVAHKLFDLLGKTIISATAIDGKNLRLLFINGTTFDVIGDYCHYESYVVTVNERSYVV